MTIPSTKVPTPHDFVQAFAAHADGWHFETDEDAARHDVALERAIESRDTTLRSAVPQLEEAGLLDDIAQRLLEMQQTQQSTHVQARAVIAMANKWLASTGEKR